MRSPTRFSTLITALALLGPGVGCTSATRPADPFVGVFAHPEVGLLELKPDGAGGYTGGLSADFGPFPVTAKRDGDGLRGTVRYGGADHDLDVRPLDGGLDIKVDGVGASPPPKPLKWYPSREAFEKDARPLVGTPRMIEGK